MSRTPPARDPKPVDSEQILARLAFEAEEAEMAARESTHQHAAENDAAENHVAEHSGPDDTSAPHPMWRLLDRETRRDPIPADRLRARFYQSLATWQAEAERPSALRRLEAWLAGFWPKRPVLQLGTAVATLLLGLLVGLTAGRPNRDLGAELGALRTELRTITTSVAGGPLDRPGAAERLRAVSLSAAALNKALNETLNEALGEALGDSRRESQDLVDELLRIASTDESENVRLAAIEALARVADRPPVRRGLADSLGRQHSPILQLAVADVLAEHGGADGELALQSLLRDPTLDPEVKTRLFELVAASSRGTL